MRYFSLVLILVLAACSTLKQDYIFDGSTPESTQVGVSKVLNHLNSKDKARFVTALLTIQFSDVTSFYDVEGDPTMLNEFNFFIIGKKIDGLSYYGVLDKAKQSKTKVTFSGV